MNNSIKSDLRPQNNLAADSSATGVVQSYTELKVYPVK